MLEHEQSIRCYQPPQPRVNVTVPSWVGAHVDGAHITICFHYLHSCIVQFVLSMLSPTTIYLLFSNSLIIQPGRRRKKKKIDDIGVVWVCW